MTTGVATEIKVGDPAPDFTLKDQDQIKEVPNDNRCGH